METDKRKGENQMSHEIMSVKLCELDERIARLHSRVRLTETTDTAALRREVKSLERQCAETAMTLRQKLGYTKGTIAGELCETYETAENRMDGMRRRLAGLIARSEAPAEEETLLAEYALDFALLAADRALLLSMKAICAQRDAEREERKLS